MRTNLTKLIILSIICLVLTLGSAACGDGYDNAKAERGRLKFAKRVIALNIGPEPIYRSVEQSFFVNGKKWSPPNDKDFAENLNWCDGGPNLKVEVLRCISDSFDKTYFLRMTNNKPELQTIDEGLPNTWINDDGRWMLFSKFYFNVETGEKINVKVIPLAGQTAFVLPLFVIGVSPDMKTIVELPDKITRKKGAEEFLTLWIIDTETGKVEEREVNFTKNPWLTDYDNGTGDFLPPPAPSKHFVWEKDTNGKDQLVIPN